MAQALLTGIAAAVPPHFQPRRTPPCFAVSLLSVSLALASLPLYAADTIKVGVLHSLSGTMAISETVLKDTVLMAIDEINAKGGVLGKKLEPSSSTPPRTGRCSPRRPSS